MSYKQEISTIYREEGLYGFTRGFSAMYLRDAPGFALYFFLFDLLKRTFGAPTEFNPENAFEFHIALRKFFAGGISGMIVWTCCYPFDTVKSMMQTYRGTNRLKFHNVVVEVLRTKGIF